MDDHKIYSWNMQVWWDKSEYFPSILMPTITFSATIEIASIYETFHHE